MTPVGPRILSPADDTVGPRRWGAANLVAGSVIGSRRAAGDPWGEAAGAGPAPQGGSGLPRRRRIETSALSGIFLCWRHDARYRRI
jgi:hypothetical protein